MIVPSRAAKRYAKALFQTALETGQSETVRADIEGLSALCAESKELSAFLPNYRLTRDVRNAVLREAFSTKLHPLTFKFVLFLESKRRLGIFEHVAASLRDLFDLHEGIVRGEITSAFELRSEEIDAISIKTRMPDKRSVLSAKVDNRLLAGFRVRIGDVIHDYSAAGRLRLLRRQFAVV